MLRLKTSKILLKDLILNCKSFHIKYPQTNFYKRPYSRVVNNFISSTRNRKNYFSTNRIWQSFFASRLATEVYLDAGKNEENIEKHVTDDLIKNSDEFVKRHIGPDTQEQALMLDYMNLKDIDDLIARALPEILLQSDPKIILDRPIGEADLLATAANLANKNKVWRSYLGMGFYNCHVPPVILRNIFENPGWYTQYTPYQPEISQGRLESLLNFQTMVCDLTSLQIANASLLDEATACAEAMSLCHRQKKRKKFLVDKSCHPQNIAVVKTRAEIVGIEIVVVDRNEMIQNDKTVCGVLLQYPDTTGKIYDLTHITHFMHQNGSMVVAATDLLPLSILRPPGEMGVDVAVGSSQRFGLPLGYGGPHSAFFATKEEFKRVLPGRIIGVSKDVSGKLAYRLALQTREQHIRRDKATSNICTAQALLANMSAMYAIYHGPIGIQDIALRIHKATLLLAEGLKFGGYEIENELFFDTITVKTSKSIAAKIKQKAEEKEINLRYFHDAKIGIALDETTKQEDLQDLLEIFDCQTDLQKLTNKGNVKMEKSFMITPLKRTSQILTHPIFNSYHSETAMMRYIKRLENKDISLMHSMIPLGSCTMKLNSSAQMMSCSLPGFSSIHPFVPFNQVEGYLQLFDQLKKDLCQITGFHNISFQPNSGAQGEYTGLRVILAYLKSIGQEHRKVCLIPESAHGTNPASAQMCAMKIEILKVLKNGDVDMQDLKLKIENNKDNLACLMITYPSTHGIFDDNIVEICDLIHRNGGQVYLDGANMNAQVGLCRPKDFGADLAHLNLHKTFCIPHGGGGPGMGPIVVKEHLSPFLPTHPLVDIEGTDSQTSFGTVTSTPFGSSLILPIPWAYIKMMGSCNLKKASQVAILNANYMMHCLKDHYKVLFLNKKGFCGHEFLVDCRDFKKTTGIEVIDVAKRLQDYGFHSPTMSFPVSGCLMIEPTESEDKQELDRFIHALISIREEIKMIEEGKYDMNCNPLKMSPHTISDVTSDCWDRPYSRKIAVFPASYINPATKFWPTIGRIDDAYGDQHFFCSCPPIESYQQEE